MIEIGSEFWTRQEPIGKEKASNEEYLLSGRTALRFIIDDVCGEREIKKVLLPSYCCESMIRPFADRGISVQFYRVDLGGVDLPFDNDADLILLIDLFGYVDHRNREFARAQKRAGKIIVYDSTHKLDGNTSVQNYADYSFCSYRKWFYCNYASAVKHNGTFNANRTLSLNDSYIGLRDRAAQRKEKYIAGIISEKAEFLSDFAAAEQMLDEDYVGYCGEPVSFDARDIILRRVENASHLIEELRNIPEIKLWRDSVKSEDSPMFVPIFVEQNIRNDLRRALISEKIYCPIHWPRSNSYGGNNELYDTEISLVCDQRYSIEDMDRIISVIKRFFSN